MAALKKEKKIVLPNNFNFHNRGIYNFDSVLSVFDWSIRDETVVIDISKCDSSSYQAMALFVPYIWHLKKNGCWVTVMPNQTSRGATKMWQFMGASGWSQVLNNEDINFEGNPYKPLIAIRNSKDLITAANTVESYIDDFNIEYEKTVRKIIVELLYNTIEHGRSYIHSFLRKKVIPSVMQITWYQTNSELQFIVADTGIGIKKHLEQTYPPFTDDASAITFALKPKVSGTFGVSDPYKSKNNAGVGLFISSGIVKRLKADMHIVSGDGVVHISPTDITSRTINSKWKGTFVLVKLHVEKQDVDYNLLLDELTRDALTEIQTAEEKEKENIYSLSVFNYFGSYAEDKEAAIKHRDKYLIPAVSAGKTIHLDFSNVELAPHSFLSALLATPIKQMGLSAFKKIKIFNCKAEIREVIDFIMDENT